MIIGLTGSMGAGKGEIVNYLKKKGFEYFVYSDILREEAKKRGIKTTRENLQKLGSHMKTEYGKGVLSDIILKKIKTNKVIVDGIRTPSEIKELKKDKNFFLIGVNAPQKKRFQRLKKRARPGDSKSFREFKKLDNLENRGKTKGQKINLCLNLADYIIINNSSLENLKKEVNKILGKIMPSP